MKRPGFEARRWTCIFSLTAACLWPCCTRCGEAPSQQYYQTTIIHDVDAIDSAAEQLRAVGDLYVSLAVGRRVTAEALSIYEDVVAKRIANRLDKLKSRFEADDARWEHQEKQRDQRLQSKINMDERQIRERRETVVSPSMTAGGNILNHLLDRLQRSQGSALGAFGSSRRLPPGWRNQLRLVAGAGAGKQIVHIANDGSIHAESTCPKSIDDEAFSLTLRRYRRSRSILDAVQGTGADDASLTEVQLGLEAVRSELNHWIDKEPISSNMDGRYQTFVEWRRWIEEQRRELLAIGAGETPPGRFNGETVEELLQFMTERGLRFARGAGGAGLYHDLFVEMRRMEASFALARSAADGRSGSTVAQPNDK